ncbi:hypothetical protein HK102_012369 [Quaeritorhiza haematococci]|nr:hypothetical protein HK102_012369 [Quaeritorhiza haematococci]
MLVPSNKRLLKDKDEIAIGERVFRYEVGEKTAPSTPRNRRSALVPHNPSSQKAKKTTTPSTKSSSAKKPANNVPGSSRSTRLHATATITATPMTLPAPADPETGNGKLNDNTDSTVSNTTTSAPRSPASRTRPAATSTPRYAQPTFSSACKSVFASLSPIRGSAASGMEEGSPTCSRAAKCMHSSPASLSPSLTGGLFSSSFRRRSSLGTATGKSPPTAASITTASATRGTVTPRRKRSASVGGEVGVASHKRIRKASLSLSGSPLPSRSDESDVGMNRKTAGDLNEDVKMHDVDGAPTQETESTASAGANENLSDGAIVADNATTISSVTDCDVKQSPAGSVMRTPTTADSQGDGEPLRSALKLRIAASGGTTKKRTVTFGPPLSPEVFDKNEPPMTPLKRGQHANSLIRGLGIGGFNSSSPESAEPSTDLMESCNVDENESICNTHSVVGEKEGLGLDESEVDQETLALEEADVEMVESDGNRPQNEISDDGEAGDPDHAHNLTLEQSVGLMNSGRSLEDELRGVAEQDNLTLEQSVGLMNSDRSLEDELRGVAEQDNLTLEQSVGLMKGGRSLEDELKGVAEQDNLPLEQSVGFVIGGHSSKDELKGVAEPDTEVASHDVEEIESSNCQTHSGVEEKESLVSGESGGPSGQDCGHLEVVENRNENEKEAEEHVNASAAVPISDDCIDGQKTVDCEAADVEMVESDGFEPVDRDNGEAGDVDPAHNLNLEQSTGLTRGDNLNEALEGVAEQEAGAAVGEEIMGAQEQSADENDCVMIDVEQEKAETRSSPLVDDAVTVSEAQTLELQPEVQEDGTEEQQKLTLEGEAKHSPPTFEAEEAECEEVIACLVQDDADACPEILESEQTIEEGASDDVDNADNAVSPRDPGSNRTDDNGVALEEKALLLQTPQNPELFVPKPAMGGPELAVESPAPETSKSEQKKSKGRREVIKSPIERIQPAKFYGTRAATPGKNVSAISEASTAPGRRTRGGSAGDASAKPHAHPQGSGENDGATEIVVGRGGKRGVSGRKGKKVWADDDEEYGNETVNGDENSKKFEVKAVEVEETQEELPVRRTRSSRRGKSQKMRDDEVKIEQGEQVHAELVRKPNDIHGEKDVEEDNEDEKEDKPEKRRRGRPRKGATAATTAVTASSTTITSSNDKKKGEDGVEESAKDEEQPLRKRRRRGGNAHDDDHEAEKQDETKSSEDNGNREEMDKENNAAQGNLGDEKGVGAKLVVGKRGRKKKVMVENGNKEEEAVVDEYVSEGQKDAKGGKRPTRKQAKAPIEISEEEENKKPGKRQGRGRKVGGDAVAEVPQDLTPVPAPEEPANQPLRRSRRRHD